MPRKMSKGFRQYVREKKGEIRRTVLDPKKQEKMIKELKDSITRTDKE